ncbi:hypothetical protein BU15DRAFT_76332 [Melanogaster broomeanus]|nr:hypothetical protein BU15DRAFT_76332 [Melanogaster broomeanus]
MSLRSIFTTDAHVQLAITLAQDLRAPPATKESDHATPSPISSRPDLLRVGPIGALRGTTTHRTDEELQDTDIVVATVMPRITANTPAHTMFMNSDGSTDIDREVGPSARPSEPPEIPSAAADLEGTATQTLSSDDPHSPSLAASSTRPHYPLELATEWVLVIPRHLVGDEIIEVQREEVSGPTIPPSPVHTPNISPASTVSRSSAENHLKAPHRRRPSRAHWTDGLACSEAALSQANQSSLSMASQDARSPVDSPRTRRSGSHRPHWTDGLRQVVPDMPPDLPRPPTPPSEQAYVIAEIDVGPSLLDELAKVTGAPQEPTQDDRRSHGGGAGDNAPVTKSRFDALLDLPAIPPTAPPVDPFFGSPPEQDKPEDAAQDEPRPLKTQFAARLKAKLRSTQLRVPRVPKSFSPFRERVQTTTVACAYAPPRDAVADDGPTDRPLLPARSRTCYYWGLELWYERHG